MPNDFRYVRDPQRLRALGQTELMDAEPISGMDRITAMATRLLKVPVSLVSLVDDERQFFLSSVGLGQPWAARRQTPLSHSFCQYVVSGNAALIVADARTDDRLRDNLAIPDLGVVAYAGYPIRTPEGHVLGSFCAIDTVRHEWSDSDLQLMQELAEIAEAEIALRLANKGLRQTTRRTQAVLDTAYDSYVAVDMAGRITAWNAAAERLFGWPAADAIDRDAIDLIIPARLRRRYRLRFDRAARTGTARLAGRYVQMAVRCRDGSERLTEMTFQYIDDDEHQLCHAFLRDITDREQDRRDRERQSRFLQVLLDSLHVGVAACDADGQLVLFNRFLRTHHGDPDEALPVHALADRYQAFEPDGVTPMPSHHLPLARAYAGETVNDAVVCLGAPGAGQRRHIATGRPITDAAGRRLGAVVVSQDITEVDRRERLKAAEHAAHRALAEAINSERAIAALIEAVGTHLECSVAEYWTVEADAMTRACVWVRPDSDVQEFVDADQASVDQGRGLPSAVRITGTAQSTRDLRAGPGVLHRHAQALAAGLRGAIGVPIGTGGDVVGVLTLLTDSVLDANQATLETLNIICDHMGRYLQRRRAEELVSALSAAAPDATVIVNQNALIVHANKTAETMFGYPHEDLIGKTVDVLIPARLRTRRLEHWDAYLADPQKVTVGAGLDLTALRHDGTEFPIEVSLAPVDTGEATLVAGAIRDITERYSADLEIRSARDEAIAAAALKSQFVAMVSHEIRTPMNGVIGLTELLLRTPLEPRQKAYAESIYTSGRALLTIINDILDFSKIEAGKVGLTETDFSLNILIQEVIRVCAEIGRGKDIEIVGYYPPDLLTTVRGDDGRLRQVLLNLLGNAVKFTHHGEVVLRVENAEKTDDGRPKVTFSVTDTGIGIAPDDIERLFEPFSQAETAASRNFGGTGLGLTISRQLIRLMGGDLHAESQPNQGTCFSFTIPLAHPTITKTSASKASMIGRRILIADDNPTSRALLTEHTQAWGMRVTAVRDGEGAINAIRRAAQADPYVVALIDQHMPDTDGLTLADNIVGHTVGTRLILLSSGIHLNDGLAESRGFSAVLTKPIVPSTLYDFLLRFFSPEHSHTASHHELPDRKSEDGTAGRNNQDAILLVEDNEINQIVAVDNLEALGYRVDVADNGAEAVQLAAKNHHYQAILMDCHMPVMDGYEATIAIRRQEPLKSHTPIIAMTAGAMPEDRQRCLAAGMDDYLSKPIDSDELRTKLARWSRVEIKAD